MPYTQEHASAVPATQGATSYTYAVDLPGTEAQLPLSFFRGKQDVLGQFAVVEQVAEDTFEAVRDPMVTNAQPAIGRIRIWGPPSSSETSGWSLTVR